MEIEKKIRAAETDEDRARYSEKKAKLKKEFEEEQEELKGKMDELMLST